jgi:hypothetical protein
MLVRCGSVIDGAKKALISEQDFGPEDGGSMFLKNFAHCLTVPTPKKTGSCINIESS